MDFIPIILLIMIIFCSGMTAISLKELIDNKKEFDKNNSSSNS